MPLSFYRFLYPHISFYLFALARPFAPSSFLSFLFLFHFSSPKLPSLLFFQLLSKIGNQTYSLPPQAFFFSFFFHHHPAHADSRLDSTLLHWCHLLMFFIKVVLLTTPARSVETPRTSSRAACVCSLWTISRSIWSWCSKDFWEITASCRWTCVESLTGQSCSSPLNHQQLQIDWGSVFNDFLGNMVLWHWSARCFSKIYLEKCSVLWIINNLTCRTNKPRWSAAEVGH